MGCSLESGIRKTKEEKEKTRADVLPRRARSRRPCAPRPRKYLAGGMIPGAHPRLTAPCLLVLAWSLSDRWRRRTAPRRRPFHPAPQAAHRLVNARIREFQAGVTRRAAAQAADPRWLHQKALATLGSWRSVRAALAAARPSPWGAVVLLMIGSFVRSVIEQFAQVGARRGAAAARARTRWRALAARPALALC